jgi:sulfoxide reductase heme-binding subunit YedZ
VVALVVTSLLRTRLGLRTWRVVHWTAYLSWPLAFVHSIGMGTDAPSLWFQVIGYACLVSVVLAVASRWLSHRPGKRLVPPVAA